MKEPEIIDHKLGPYIDPPYTREATVEAIATSLGGGDSELDYTDSEIKETFEPDALELDDGRGSAFRND